MQCRRIIEQWINAATRCYSAVLHYYHRVVLPSRELFVINTSNSFMNVSKKRKIGVAFADFHNFVMRIIVLPRQVDRGEGRGGGKRQISSTQQEWDEPDSPVVLYFVLS